MHLLIEPIAGCWQRFCLRSARGSSSAPRVQQWLSTVLLIAFAVGGRHWLPGRPDRRPQLLAVGSPSGAWRRSRPGWQDPLELQAARAGGYRWSDLRGVALTLLMDMFPRTRRGRVLAIFYLAMPVGAALGISLGAAVAPLIGGKPRSSP